MKRSDKAGGLIWIGLGISLCIESVRLNLGNFHKPGPGFIPFFIGAFLVLLGVILVFSTSVGLGEGGPLKDGKSRVEKRKGLKNVIIVLVVLLAYYLLLETLGFLLTSFLFLFFLFKLTTPKRWLMPLIFSISAVTLSYLLFVLCLHCRFPRGILLTFL